VDDLELRNVLRQGEVIALLPKFLQVCINLFDSNTIRPQLGDQILIILSDDGRTDQLVQVQPSLFRLLILTEVEASGGRVRENLRLSLDLPPQKIFKVIDEVNRLIPRLLGQLLVECHYILAYPRYVLPQARVKVILDCIVSAPTDYLRDLSPLVSQGLMSLDELHLLQVAPLLLVNAWIQVVVPSKK